MSQRETVEFRFDLTQGATCQRQLTLTSGQTSTEVGLSTFSAVHFVTTDLLVLQVWQVKVLGADNRSYLIFRSLNQFQKLYKEVREFLPMLLSLTTTNS